MQMWFLNNFVYYTTFNRNCSTFTLSAKSWQCEWITIFINKIRFFFFSYQLPPQWIIWSEHWIELQLICKYFFIFFLFVSAEPAPFSFKIGWGLSSQSTTSPSSFLHQSSITTTAASTSTENLSTITPTNHGRHSTEIRDSAEPCKYLDVFPIFPFNTILLWVNCKPSPHS